MFELLERNELTAARELLDSLKHTAPSLPEIAGAEALLKRKEVPEKRNLHSALLAEQGSVCCYCGRSIGLDDSHIEHFKPQERYDELQVDYANLHASCMRRQQRSIARRCGHAKDNGFDEDQYIAPVDPDCEQRFMYTLRGTIIPTEPN